MNRCEISKAWRIVLTAFMVLFSNPASANTINIDNLLVMGQPDTRKAAAVIMKITNFGHEDDVLLSIDAPIARFAKPHQTSLQNNEEQMHTSDVIVIPAQTSVELKDNGLHIMLMGLKRKLKQGKILSMTLHFKQAGAVKVKAPIQMLEHKH